MLDLAQCYNEDRFVSLCEIAEKEELSLKYLEKIMTSLKKQDYFETCRGSDGGYKLKLAPNKYRIGDIIKAAEENIDIVSCISSDSCPNKGTCRTFPLWKGLSDEINDYLNSKTLEDYL